MGVAPGKSKNLLGYRGPDSDEDDKLSDFSYHSYASAQDYHSMHKVEGEEKFRT